MMVCKRFEIKRGQILYRDEIEFKSLVHELFWRAMMKSKGCQIKKNRQSLTYTLVKHFYIIGVFFALIMTIR